MPAGLASIMAMLLAKSPWVLSRAFSTWIAGVRPSGNTPSLTSWVRACWISWRMVSFMVFSFDRKRGGASMRRWKNWALSVARAGLPTFCWQQRG
jgi:hypothetical protein